MISDPKLPFASNSSSVGEFKSPAEPPFGVDPAPGSILDHYLQRRVYGFAGLESSCLCSFARLWE